MTDYDKELTGVLFVNKYKKRDAQPDYTGNVTVDGVEYRMAGWKKTARSSGEEFVSLALTSPEEQAKFQKKDEDGIDKEDVPF